MTARMHVPAALGGSDRAWDMPATMPLSDRLRASLAALLCAGSMLIAPAAHADQRRDFMFEPTPSGDYFIFDYVTTGVQLTLEHRTPIYGQANEVGAGVKTLLVFPFGQVTAYTKLRVLFLEVSAGLGYRANWRNLHFAAGKDSYCKDCDRGARRARDPLLESGDTNTDRYGYAEGKLQLYAPLNEHMFFTSELAAQYEDSQDRSYDWFYCDIHDGGVVARSESTLFFKQRDLGAIGPYLQVMSLPRSGKHETEVAIGFNALTRAGLLDRNDLLFLTFLMRPGDPNYGHHAYFAPVRALLIYRATFAL